MLGQGQAGREYRDRNIELPESGAHNHLSTLSKLDSFVIIWIPQKPTTAETEYEVSIVVGFSQSVI